jgi:hypothetical protein
LQLLKDWMAPGGRHRGHSAPLGSQGAGELSGSAIRSCGVTGSFVLCDVLPRQFQPTDPYVRANTLLTDFAYHAPPRGVLMPRALRASAI